MLIDDTTIVSQSMSTSTAQENNAKLAYIAKQARQENPKSQLMFFFFTPEDSRIGAVSGNSESFNESNSHITIYDDKTGERLNIPPPNKGVMHFILDLHGSLLLGLPGTFILTAIGLIIAISIISGVVVYAPYARKLKFGTVRKEKNIDIKRLDTHNMMGIVTLAWVLAVTITGVILTLVTPLTAIWQQGEIAAIVEQYKQDDVTSDFVSPDIVRDSLLEKVPDALISFISLPGSPYATPQNYTIGWKGDTPFTAHLLTVAVVSGRTGEVLHISDTPWYLDMVNLSVPLHFGDYGGLPLKIVWAILDVIAVVVLWTGLMLWLRKYRKKVNVNVDLGVNNHEKI